MLCTITDIKDFLGETGSEFDDLLTFLAAGFTARADTFCRRTLLATAANVTEYFTGSGDYLQLTRYPVIAITSIKEAWAYDFTSATALVVNTEYRLLDSGLKGLLLRLYGDWCDQPDGIQVVYRGGYIAAGTTPQTGETAVPSDLRMAAVQQCAFMFKRRDDIGLSGVSFNGGSFSKFESLKLLPEVEAVLNAYRRLSL